LAAQSYKAFHLEFFSLTHRALNEDKDNYNFREIYNPYSGKPDGSYHNWEKYRPNYDRESCKFQTWLAVALYFNGLSGMRFDTESLSFAAFLPEEIGLIELRDAANCDLNLNVSIEGQEHTI
jgi:hypothetical protein